MSEFKAPRVLAAAKEFNIGKDTMVAFLVGKGFSKDDLGPTAKLTEPMYKVLLQEFAQDKAAKNKADLVEIPKSTATEKKRKEDEEITFARKEAKPAREEPLKVQPAEGKAAAAKPAPEVKPTPEVKAAPVVKEEPAAKPVQPEAEVTKVEAPEIEGPKVVGKIDLPDSNTRPKKAAAKKKDAKVAEEAAAPAPAPQPEAPSATPLTEEAPPAIENIKAPELEGPKILGKIDLPVNSDTRPVRDEKRKRKRIPIDKRGADSNVGTGFVKPGGAGSGRSGVQGGQFNRGPQRPVSPRKRPTLTPAGQTDKEIDQKQIQDKIRETQAKLAGGSGRGRSVKSKNRRTRREEAAGSMGGNNEDNKLQVTEFVTVSELANLMDVSFADIISKCMGLGIMVSINQRLDAEVIELVAGEFGFEVDFTSLDDEEDEEEEVADNPDDLQPRAPIVTIMGHVDHGKTSLLDYIRSANVVAGEAGGITQHIGAYEVTLPGSQKNITFLDTPGHEAFTAMRARGAKVTDIAVIVVAADDAVMPQTREAISHAQAAGVPMIFAVNKIDKDGAKPEKIYEQLSAMNILVESWGGKFQSQELSARSGLNVDSLLEKILLEAELLDLKANPNREATGTILEASLDKGRGYVASVLVENGTLKHGDIIVSGPYFGRVKAMFNERNVAQKEAQPSAPVQILGLNGAPQAGEKFKVFEDEAEAKETAARRSQIMREQGLRARKHITLDEIGRRLALGNFKELNIIIKGDVDGSVEALSDSLQKLSTAEIAVRVILKGVGQISESDVVLATASDAVILGFNVRPSQQANRLAEQEGVEIKTYSIIYNAIEEIKSAMEGMLEPKIQEKVTGNVEIREVFKFDKATVAGCYVLDGKVSRNSKIRVIRDGIVEYPRGEGGHAELASLKRFKDDVKEVSAGYECGLTVKNFADIKVGDIIEAFEEEEVKRTL